MPFLVGVTLNDKYWHEGYVYEQSLLASLAILGFISNVWLYVDDIKNRGRVLDMVCKEEGGVIELMAQPVI